MGKALRAAKVGGALVASLALVACDPGPPPQKFTIGETVYVTDNSGSSPFIGTIVGYNKAFNEYVVDESQRYGAGHLDTWGPDNLAGTKPPNGG